MNKEHQQIDKRLFANSAGQFRKGSIFFKLGF